MAATPAQPTADQSRYGIIEVEVNDVAQLFNSIDPTPFPEKDLDRGAEEFITGWAMELPRHMPLMLVIHLNKPAVHPDSARVVEEGIQTYFSHKAEVIRRRLVELLSRGRLSLVIGLVFLSVCLTGANFFSRLGKAQFFEILHTGLIIVGWVAMWRPLEIFLYEWWPLLRERRICQRLSRAKVEVVIRADKPAGPGTGTKLTARPASH